jgi:hypothetical protein
VLATPSEQAEQDALLEWLKSSSHKQQAQRDDEVGFRQYLQAGRRSSLDQALLKLLLPPARSSVPGVYALDPTDRPGAGPSTVLGARLRPVGVGVRGGSIDCAAATPPAGAPPAARGAQVDGRAFAADLLDIVVPSRIAPSIMTATSGLSRTGSRRAGRPARRRAGSQRAACRRRKPADRGPARSVGAHAGEGDHRHPDGLLRLRTSHPHRVWAAACLPTGGVAALANGLADAGLRLEVSGSSGVVATPGAEVSCRLGHGLAGWLWQLAGSSRDTVGCRGEPWPPAWTAVSRRVSLRWQ